jgi:hypothetical protein
MIWAVEGIEDWGNWHVKFGSHLAGQSIDTPASSDSSHTLLRLLRVWFVYPPLVPDAPR